jgi:two-component system, cell cycle sensor histidine kinase and response regulator CckA
MDERQSTRLLVVEDDEGIAFLQQRALQRAGYQVFAVTSEDAALAHLAAQKVDLVILDFRLPGERTGLDLYDEIKHRGYNPPAIVVTGFSDESTMIQAMRSGVRDFVRKSSTEYLETLSEAVDRVLRQIGLEEKLADAEARFQSFLDNGPAVSMIKNADGLILFANRRFESVFSHLPWRGKHDHELFPGERYRELRDGDRMVLASGHAAQRVDRHTMPDGRTGHWLTYSFPIEGTQGPPLLGVVAVDITDRTVAEEALRASEAKFRSVTESASDAIIATDSRGRIISWNAGAGRMFGYDSAEALERSVHELLPHPELGEPRVAAGELTATISEFPGNLAAEMGRRRDGTEFPIEMSVGSWQNANQVFFSVIIRDVTERKLAEAALGVRDAQLRQSQKLEAIGTLAGGVAHEFNNLLQTIQGFTQYAIEALPRDSEGRHDLEQVLQATGRASSLTRQLLGFGRREMLQKADVNPNAVVRDMVKMLGPLIGATIEIELKLDDSVGMVHADPAHLQQLLMNLCVNARDAMPQGGKLLIRTEDLIVSPEYCEFHPDVTPGRYLVLNVSDTGGGIPEEVRDHIFEPFFTTKEVGKGTGLGLAMVYGVVQQHGGVIRVYSETGLGTTFRIYLPTIEREVAAPVVQQPASARGGDEIVLIAEDDPFVRKLAVRILQRAGYGAIIAADGREAVDLFELHKDEVALVILDIVMPRMGGRDAFELIRASRPELPVIFCSGYDPELADTGHAPPSGTPLLQKPFDPEVFLRTVRETLDRQLSATS